MEKKRLIELLERDLSLTREDILLRCWEEAQEERDALFLKLLKEEGCSSERLEYWKNKLKEVQ